MLIHPTHNLHHNLHNHPPHLTLLTLLLLPLISFATPQNMLNNNNPNNMRYKHNFHKDNVYHTNLNNNKVNYYNNNDNLYYNSNHNDQRDNLEDIPPFNNTEALTGDHCEGSSFIADCSQNDSVVVIISAKYGRMNSIKCMDEKNIEASCQKDMLAWMEQRCGGRRRCEVRVSQIVDLVSREGCMRSVRGFLQTSYVCLPVVSRPPNACQAKSSSSSSSSSSSPSHIKITKPYGFLANTVTMESGCGSMGLPWLLEASKGHSIVVTLLDFTTTLNKRQGSDNNCNVFAMIKEGDNPHQTICGGERKVSTVYVSQEHTISVVIVALSSSPSSSLSSSSHSDHFSEQPFFLLKFSVTGCSDIEEVGGLVVERMGGVSVVSCGGRGGKHQVVCRRSAWVGHVPDCLAMKGLSSSSFFTSFWNTFSESQWVAVATILSIALIIGVVIFISGILCLKRRRQAFIQEPCGTPRCLVEYHLPRAGHPLERNGSVHSKSLSMDIIGGGNSAEGCNAENDYFRTWQMHERGNNLASIYQTHHNVMTSSFKPLLQDDDRGRHLPPPSDHIYESPNFDRKLYTSPPPPPIPQSPTTPFLHPPTSIPPSLHSPSIYPLSSNIPLTATPSHNHQ